STVAAPAGRTSLRSTRWAQRIGCCSPSAVSLTAEFWPLRKVMHAVLPDEARQRLDGVLLRDGPRPTPFWREGADLAHPAWLRATPGPPLPGGPGDQAPASTAAVLPVAVEIPAAAGSFTAPAKNSA